MFKLISPIVWIFRTFNDSLLLTSAIENHDNKKYNNVKPIFLKETSVVYILILSQSHFFFNLFKKSSCVWSAGIFRLFCMDDIVEGNIRLVVDARHWLASWNWHEVTEAIVFNGKLDWSSVGTQGSLKILKRINI